MARWNTVALGALLGLLWADGLPVADAKPRHETDAHAQAYGRHRAVRAHQSRHPRATAVHSDRVQKGKASVYAQSLRGRRMADGTPFNPASNAAASKTLPLGTTARVTNLNNGRTATVRVRDRGPHRAGRIIDVRPGSADALGMKRDGVAPVAVAPLTPPRAGGTE